MKAVFIGDSRTMGEGSWTRILAARHPEVSCEWYMAASSGELTSDVPQAELYFIEVGGNDLRAYIPPEAIAHNVEKCVKRIRKDNPHSAILICDLYDLADGVIWIVRLATKDLHDRYKQIASNYGGWLIPERQVFWGHCWGRIVAPKIAPNNGERFLALDIIHPNTAGFRELSDHVDRMLDELRREGMPME